MAAKALQAGCTVVQSSLLEWDVSSDCETPFTREHRSVPVIPPDREQRFRRSDYGSPLSVVVKTRCHTCPSCLKARYWLWRLRSTVEMAEATRTWFGTLTLSPEAHFNVRCRADLDLRKRCLRPFDEGDADAQFVARHNQITRDMQLYFKRVRKQSGAAIRYLAVCEAHKSGLPHYHLLVHQIGETPVLKKHLEDWPLGFTQWKLVDDLRRSSYYVTKYLLKEARARLRASVLYGRHYSGASLSPPLGLTSKKEREK